jgi:ankyrin repeat protein
MILWNAPRIGLTRPCEAVCLFLCCCAIPYVVGCKEKAKEAQQPTPQVAVVKVSPEATKLLYDAVDKNQTQTVKELIARGADVNVKSDTGWPALIAAASNGNTEISGLLLQAGAKVDAKEERNGGTALYWAAAGGHTDTVKLLLDAKANPNLQNDHGIAPLMAVSLTYYPPGPPEKTCMAIADLLLGKGADVNEPDGNGMLPRGAAASNGLKHMADFLKEHGGKCVAGSSGSLAHNCRD